MQGNNSVLGVFYEHSVHLGLMCFSLSLLYMHILINYLGWFSVRREWRAFNDYQSAR